MEMKYKLRTSCNRTIANQTNFQRNRTQAKDCQTLRHKYRSRFAQLMKTAPKLTIALAAVLSRAAPVEAASFNFTYAPGTTLEQMLGFEVAANVWSNFLVDDVEVNLFVEVVDWDELPPFVVGGSLPGLQSYDYSQFQTALQNDRTSNNDWAAYANLNHADSSNNRYSAYFENNYQENDRLSLSNANAKALGLRPSHDNAIDSYIVMSDLSGLLLPHWDYNTRRDSSIPFYSLDYTSVAIHEIGHALGFISGIDSALVADVQASVQQNLDRLNRTSALDMFRYSVYTEDEENLDLAVGIDSYFSLDGGETPLAHFSTGTQDLGLGFDGFQGSHWKQQSNELGIMDPLIFLGERRDVKALDLQAFDSFGWDLRSDLRDGISSSELNLNWFDLTSQAEQRLANSLGISVADLWANSTTSANSLTSWIDSDNDGIDDRVEQMLVDSEVYNWCTSNCNGGGGGSGGGSGGSGGGGWQTGLWQEFRWQTLPTEAIQANAQSVPEPTSTVGLLALGTFGISSRLKRRSRKL